VFDTAAGCGKFESDFYKTDCYAAAMKSKASYAEDVCACLKTYTLSCTEPGLLTNPYFKSEDLVCADNSLVLL
jgi:hypothetical protein